MGNICTQPDLGRIEAVGLFLLDDVCVAPIYGPDTGYIDLCPAAVSTTDKLDNGKDFTRSCSDGSLRRYIAGITSLQSIEVNVDFHWLDPAWVGAAGAAEPIISGGDVIGWSDCTDSRFNVLVVVQQELLGSDACSSGSFSPGCTSYIRLYPLKGAYLTETGDIGSDTNMIRLTGQTTATHQLGSGPVKLACDPLTGEAVWLTNCLPSGCHRFRFIGAPLPSICGTMDTTAPTVSCTPTS